MRPVSERPLLPQAIPGNIPGLVAYTSGLGKQLLNVFQEYGFRINRTLPKDGSEVMTGPMPLASYTTATRPTASDHEGAVIYVSDASSGANFQGSDGTNWVSLG